MFEVVAASMRKGKTEMLEQDGEIPVPPPTWIPPLGASRRTWSNVYKNKSNIDYCVAEFHYLSNR
eukprot:749787-Hanusia_phi.AAC.1